MELILSTDKKTEIKMSAPKSTISISGAKGTKNHQALYNLDYENSGHTGFQKELTFDDTPTEGSNNPVKSDGIKTELDKKANTSDVYTRTEVGTELDKKANTTEVYTKAETDTKLDKKQNILTFDDTPTSGSNNPVTSGSIKTELDKKVDIKIPTNGGATFIDGGSVYASIFSTSNDSTDNMAAIYFQKKSSSSYNDAFQILEAGFTFNKLNEKADKTELEAKQDALTFDDTPTEGSNNPVKSGGIKTELDKKADSDSVYTKTETDTALDALKLNSVPHTTVSGYPMTVTDHLGGENVLDYKIYGNSIQNGTPATDTPIDIQSVGDLVTDTASEYYGKYDIPLYVGGVLTTHIYLNAPLRKVGSSADYIDFKTQKVVRYIKEQTFDGTENWFYRESDTLLYLTAIPNMASSSYCVSTHFLDESRKDTGSTPYVRPVTNVLRIYQQPSNILWSTAAEFKAFLTAQKTAGTPLIVDYVLTEPTEESISAANFLLPDGEIVSMAAGTDTAPSKIDLEYYQDINKVIAEIKAAILSNGGNV